MSAREKLNPCPWCGKYSRNTSGWEQLGSRPARPDDDPAEVVTGQILGSRVTCWRPLCVRCANKRLDNPFSTVRMRRVGEDA
jgi:hypothetical protein